MSGDREATEAAEAVIRKAGADRAPRAGIVLGSGLGGFARAIEEPCEIAQAEIPHYPAARVAGHRGSVVLGRLSGVSVVCSVGRCHAYEGRSLAEVAFPVRVMRAMGADTLVVTSATGGVHPELGPGDLVLVSDHINLMGGSPLEPKVENGCADGFVDMTCAYDAALADRARAAARALGIGLFDGVLAALRGPQFETPAEVRMLRTLGADVVCMSFVPEVIMARKLSLRVLGLAVVANKAAGLHGGVISHEEVLSVVGARAADVAALVGRTLAA